MQFFNEVESNFNNIINTISLIDIIDILIVSIIIYIGIILIRDTRVIKIIKGLAIFIIVYFVSAQFGLKSTAFIFSSILQFSIIGSLIVFQPELRRLVEQISNNGIVKRMSLFSSNYDKNDVATTRNNIVKIANACFSMAKTKTGALIVMEKDITLVDIVNTGVVLNATISEEVIKNIFFHNAPLHDGATIIKNNKIIAAGCFLPLSQKLNISTSLGTRHRASIGITETTDCFVIVVSEETGCVSFSKSGRMVYDLQKDELVNILNQEFIYETGDKKNENMGFLKGVLKYVFLNKNNYKKQNESKVTFESNDKEKQNESKVTFESNDEEKQNESKVTFKNNDEEKQNESKVTFKNNDKEKQNESKVTFESNDEEKQNESKVTFESNDEEKQNESKVTFKNNDKEKQNESKVTFKNNDEEKQNESKVIFKNNDEEKQNESKV